MPRIISWNVLYRKYEEKYNPSSKILEKYPKEEDRDAAILALFKEKVDSDTVVCLQEASSAICTVLATAFEETHRVFAYNIRDDEHLVTVAPKEFEMMWGGPHETSNGYLVVYNGPTYIINCHLLPRRFSRVSVMSHLRSFLEEYNGLVFIAGDFNEIHRMVEDKLGEVYTCPYYGKTYKRKPIDHIIFNANFAKYDTALVKQNYISDHHAIELNFEL